MMAIRLMSCEIPCRDNSQNPMRISDFAGHCGSPPAFSDCSLRFTERIRKGTDVISMTMVSGSRKTTCPKTSMKSRTLFGNMLLTMSIRTCSLDNSVQGEQNRNTTPNKIHCSSSQALDEVSKTLRTVALAADTTTTTRISQDIALPI